MVTKIKILIILIIVLCITIYAGNLKTNDPYHNADSGLIYSLTYQIYQNKTSESSLFAAISDALFVKNIMTKTRDEVCNEYTELTQYSNSDKQFLKYHSNLILYIISPLMKIWSAEIIINYATILSFILFILISTYILKKQNIRNLIITLTIFLILFHPAWSQSIMGQPYVDRFFLPIGLLTYYFLDTKKYKSTLILYIFSILINEKVAIYQSIFLITFSVLFYQRDKNINKVLIGIGVISLIFIYIIMNLFMSNPYYSSAIPKNFNELLNYLQNERNINGIISLLKINLILLIVPLIYARKYFILSFIFLIPNLFGNIGGAEKIGFLTHYHSLYYPFLVYGFIKSLTLIPLENKKHYLILIIILISSTTYYLNFKSHSDLNLEFGRSKINFISYFSNLANQKNNFEKIRNDIESVIPTTKYVTAIDSAFPYLYKYENIYFYPIGLKQSDYVLTRYYYDNDNEIQYIGYVSYLSKDHEESVNECLSNTIKLKYNTDDKIFLDNSIVLIKAK